jgi:hypothetical protein
MMEIIVKFASGHYVSISLHKLLNDCIMQINTANTIHINQILVIKYYDWNTSASKH